MSKDWLKQLRVLAMFAAILGMTGCAGAPAAAQPQQPDQAVTGAFATKPPAPTPTAAVEAGTVWVSRETPSDLAETLLQNSGWRQVSDPSRAAYRLELMLSAEAPPDALQVVERVYVLAAPFPTVPDGLTEAEFRRVWRSRWVQGFGLKPVLMNESTRRVMETLLGKPAHGGVTIRSTEALLDAAWEERPSLAILPFDELQPRWKVLRVAGSSPFELDFDPDTYLLTARFVLRGEVNGNEQVEWMPPSNRDPGRMTVLMLTGTTALARQIALRMEEKGILYPASDIGDKLLEADLLHISNEAPFYDQCPPAKPLRAGMRFCSDPGYIELLNYVGADVVELTGNHIFDWGAQAFLDSVELYHRHGIQTYGGGKNKETARQPLLLEHNGNRIALLGCNAMGPENILAKHNQPGAAPCDLLWMEDRIAELNQQGYQVVVTFQHMELNRHHPHGLQRLHFRSMAEAGAVIVSGSQAHFPQTFSFAEGNLIHFGLGNLFFDQMQEGNRRAFIDRHVFYDGRYLGVELLTTMLEDHARPRLMTPEERAALLEAVFAVGEW